MIAMDDALRAAYRKHRADGCTARHSLDRARYDTAGPRWEWLAALTEYTTEVTGRVGAYDVSVTVEPDDEARLGEDDVTGTFVDVEEPGVTVLSTRNGYNGSGCKFYRPSNYRREHSYDEARRAGMSKAQARAEVARLIDLDMHDDAWRQWYGITVTVSIDARELGEASLWGIDSVPGYDIARYLREVAAELIGEAIGQARASAPKIAEMIEEQAERMRADLPVRLAALADLAAKIRAAGQAPDPTESHG